MRHSIRFFTTANWLTCSNPRTRMVFKSLKSFGVINRKSVWGRSFYDERGNTKFSRSNRGIRVSFFEDTLNVTLKTKRNNNDVKFSCAEVYSPLSCPNSHKERPESGFEHVSTSNELLHFLHAILQHLSEQVVSSHVKRSLPSANKNLLNMVAPCPQRFTQKCL